MSDDWRDDPAVQDALLRVHENLAMVSQPAGIAEAELAAHGMYPVSVVTGDPESDEVMSRIRRVSPLASRLGCRSTIGRGDAATYLFPDPQAAAAFILEVAGFMVHWWTVTATAQPVYDKIDGLEATLMPGLRDPLPDLIGPQADWERCVNAWCNGRDLAAGWSASRDPGQYQAAAVKRLGPAFRAARRGHIVQHDPPAGDRTPARRWACVRKLPGGKRCLAPLFIDGTRISGAAVTSECEGGPHR